MKSQSVTASELIAKKVGAVNPAKHVEEVFDLFSIPAYDSGKPEIVKGSDIGSTKKCVEPNDVLISRIVPHIRRCWVVPKSSSRRQIASGEWITFRSDRFFPNYIRHYLMSDRFHKEFMQTVSGVGGSLLRARPTEVERIEIPMPPINEQKRIADILDISESIRRKRQQAAKLTDKFLRSAFLEMFGDPIRNTKGWKTNKLGELSRIRRGASPRPIKDYVGGDVPWIKIGDGTKGNSIYLGKTAEHITKAGAEKSLYLESGSLIFANCGVSLGFARILSIAGCIHDGWLAIDQFQESLNEIFLLKLLNSATNYFRAIAPDGTQPNLNTGIMNDLMIPVPPKDLQERFAAIVSTTTNQTKTLEDLESESNDLFYSLSQQAFCGEL